MKKTILALSCLLTATLAFSQQQSLPKLIKPSVSNYNYATTAVEFNGRYYCNTYGNLYTSDGTEAGSFVVKYLNNISCIKPMNGKLYFIASDGNGTELWVSDGTDAGTSMIKDINPGVNPVGNGVYKFSYDNAMVVMGNNLYFYGFDGVNGVELWKSDGTAQGTQMVKDINPNAANAIDTGMYIPNESLLAVDNKVFFSADDGVHGPELWVTDGTPAGTSLVSDLYTGASPNLYAPDNFMRFNNRVVFFAIDNAGVNVFISDGTAGGTVKLLPNIGSYTTGYTVDNNKLYFFADSATSTGIRPRLYVSDGTAAGTQLIKEVDPYVAFNPSRKGFLTAYNSKLYFSAAATINGEMELWESDGTPGGTQLLKNLVATSYSSQPAQLTVFNGKLYMRAADTSGRNEIWESDGTSQGTKKVVYANADAKLSPIVATRQNRSVLTRVGNSLFFWNYYGTKDGNALYKIDLFPDNITEVKEIKNKHVYPNPVSATLRLSEDLAHISVYNTNGQEVMHIEGPVHAVQVQELPAGLYIITGQDGSGKKVNEQFIKQ